MRIFYTFLQLFIFVALSPLAAGAQISISCPSFFETVVNTDPGQCTASMVDYNVTATGGSGADLPAFYPLYDDLADALGNANDAMLSSGITPPSPGNPLCIPPTAFWSTNFRTPSFPNSFDGNAFKFSVEFKLNGYHNETAFSTDPILVMSPSLRWIGIFTDKDGFIGISYLNSNYPRSTTTVNLDQWYKAELVFDNGTAYLYLDDILIQTVVTGPLAYPGFYSLADRPNTSNLLTGNGSNGNALNGCIRNVRVSNLNDDEEPEPVEITITDNAPDVFPLGYTYVTATATDGSSSASCSFYVQVIDNQPPEAVCKNTTVQIQPGGSAFLSNDDLLDFDQTTDNCNFYLAGSSQSYVYCEDVGNTIPVDVVVADFTGNIDNCAAMITVEEGNALPSGWTGSGIGFQPLGASATYLPCTAPGQYTVTGSGNNAAGTTTDNVSFASQYLCGDGSITAKVESISPNGYAGLMIRESLASGAKQVSVFSNLSPLLRHEVRYATYGPKTAGTFSRPFPYWLKLQRQGNLVIAYSSADGANFQFVHAVQVPMQSCVQVGLASYTYLPNTSAEAVFSNVQVSGGGITRPGENEPAEVVDALISLPQSPGVEETSEAPAFHIYPNPARGQFVLELDHYGEQDSQVFLFNQYGQQVANRQLLAGESRLEWPTHNLPAGTYWLRVVNADGLHTAKKLVVLK